MGFFDNISTRTPYKGVRHALRGGYTVFISGYGPQNRKTIVPGLCTTPVISLEQRSAGLNGLCDPAVMENDFVLVLAPFTYELFSLPRFRVYQDDLCVLWIRADECIMFLDD